MDDGVSATRYFAPQPNKANGRLLENLEFDIFPLYMMFLLATLINVTLIFMLVAVHRKQHCKLLMLEKLIADVVIPSFLTEAGKSHASLCQEHAQLNHRSVFRINGF